MVNGNRETEGSLASAFGTCSSPLTVVCVWRPIICGTRRSKGGGGGGGDDEEEEEDE